jgi:hypothetical protein
LDDGIKLYFGDRQLRLKDPALLKAHISENLRQQFDANRVAERERANAVAQFNRLCDVLEKM